MLGKTVALLSAISPYTVFKEPFMSKIIEKPFFVKDRQHTAIIRELEPSKWVAFCPGVSSSYGEGCIWEEAFYRMLHACSGTTLKPLEDG